jgi:hypothetical protein
MRDSKETKAKMKDIAPGNEIDLVMKRVEELEERCTQIETTLKDSVTYDALANRITGKKIVKKRRAKREWSEEEKKAFHERMVAARQAKEKARQEAAKPEAKKK